MDNASKGIHVCAQVGDTDSLLSLVDKGANLNAKDEDERTALHWGCANGKLAVVELLLDIERVDVNTKDDGVSLSLVLARFTYIFTPFIYKYAMSIQVAGRL